MRICVTILLYLLCSPAIGQVDSTAYIQNRLDTENVVDLAGKTYYVKYVVVGPQHNGKSIKNGSLLVLPDKTSGRHAIIEIVKGRAWRGVVYPDQPLNFTIDSMEIGGAFRCSTDDVNVNVANGKRDGWWCSCVSVVAPTTLCWVDSLTVTNSKFFGVAASGVSARARLFAMSNCSFEHIGQHAFSNVIDSGPDVPVYNNIANISVRDCGTAFDFTAASRDFTYTTPKVVTINGLTARNIYGRTKFQGPWSGRLNNMDFEQDRFIASQYGAMNFPEGNDIEISNVRIKNFWYAGITTLYIPTAKIQPKIKASYLKIENALNGLYIQCDFKAYEVQMVNCWNTYTSSNPTEAVNVTNANAKDTVYWAKQANRAEDQVRSWNAMYGTTYTPWSRWWIPDAVKTEAMEQRN